MKNKLTALVLIFLMVATACSKVPVLGRRQLALLPDSEVNSMALQEYQDFLSKNQVISTGTNADIVKRVGDKLSKSTDEFLRANGYASLADQFKWEYHLVQNNEANAWCMPGGKIVVYSGIMPIAQDEQGLAVVLGHEIAHAVARHGDERMSIDLAEQLGGVALSVALAQKPQETQNLFLQAYGLGSTIGVTLPFSRTQETEADKLGLILMANAGYDPQTALTFWERMKTAMQGAAPPEFLSDHPSDETRISNIKAFMPKAMKYYKQP
jgi:predicted Zn-dependent protease